MLLCREKRSCYTPKKALILRKKKRKNGEKSVISIGTNWFLVSQNEVQTEEDSTEDKYGQGAAAAMVTPALTSWPFTCVFTDLVFFFSTYGPVKSMNSCIYFFCLAVS